MPLSALLVYHGRLVQGVGRDDGDLPLRVVGFDQERRVVARLLVRRGAEVIVREHRANRSVQPVVVQRRVGVEVLDGRLGAVPILEGWGLAEETPLRGRLGIEGVTFVDGDDLQLPLRRPLVLGGLVEFVDPSLGVDGRDALADLLRAERAIFVIEAVTGAVGRGDIELHEMDVLAQNIGRVRTWKSSIS